MRVYDVGSPFGLATRSVFAPWKPEIVTYNRLADVEDNIDKIDLISFGGGADIHPSVYKHYTAGSHVSGNNPSYRDLFEMNVWKLAIAHKKPIFGICRGAQLACALSGGFLVQHVEGHANGEHMITTNEGRKLDITSYHHQLMVPHKINHELIAWATATNRVNSYMWDTSNMSPKQFDSVAHASQSPEIVYFKDTNALGIQGHPEFYSDAMEEAVVYSRQLINKYLLKGAMPDV